MPSYVRCPTCNSESYDFSRLVHAADCEQIGTKWRMLEYIMYLGAEKPEPLDTHPNQA